MPGFAEHVEDFLVGDFGGAQQRARFTACIDATFREAQGAEQQIVAIRKVHARLRGSAGQLNVRIRDPPHLAHIVPAERRDHGGGHRNAGAIEARPNTPRHQDAGWDLTSFEEQYSSFKVLVPAAMEDAVLFM